MAMSVIMMNKKIIIIVSLLIILIVILNIKPKSTEKQQVYDEKNSGIYLNGDLITYLGINDKYEEEGAIAKDEYGRDISKGMSISYFNGKKQIFNINTMFAGTYTVKYQIKEKGETFEATRVVVVNDTNPPVFEEIETKIVKVSEISSLDLTKDLSVTDESGKVDINCENIVKAEPGEYVVTCRAKDRYGNESKVKRLIKVET